MPTTLLHVAHFVKSHGLGNDYLVCDPADVPFALTPARVQLICHRHFGIGSDGILVLSKARGGAEVALRILNPDGSEAEKSGNGIRIFARWLFDTGRVASPSFHVHTAGGIVGVELELARGRVASVTADMGPVAFRTDLQTLAVEGETVPVTALSIGNPHCVVLRERLEVDELRRWGPVIERHPSFPDRTNVQLAHVVDRRHVQALIWERGAGETLASGSSSCAVAAACHRLGLVDDEVTVEMPGGDLFIRLARDGHVWMRGPAEEICSVTLSQDLLDRLLALG